MKSFETPVVDVKKFDVMDVLTTSGVVEPSSEVVTSSAPCPENTLTPCFDD